MYVQPRPRYFLKQGKIHEMISKNTHQEPSDETRRLSASNLPLLEITTPPIPQISEKSARILTMQYHLTYIVTKIPACQRIHTELPRCQSLYQTQHECAFTP